MRFAVLSIVSTFEWTLRAERTLVQRPTISLPPIPTTKKVVGLLSSGTGTTCFSSAPTLQKGQIFPDRGTIPASYHAQLYAQCLVGGVGGLLITHTNRAWWCIRSMGYTLS